MGQTASSESEVPSRGFLAVVRKIDDAVFAIEKSIVAFALITITIVVFIDLVARRITAPDSKIGRLLAKVARIEDFETREWIDQNVAPWVTLVLALLLLGFGAYSGRRFARARAGATEDAPAGRELAIAAAAAVLTTALGWGIAQLFVHLDSWMIYSGAFALGTLGVLAYFLVQKPEGWVVRAVSTVVSGAVLVWVSMTYVPEGYTWSKKVSLALLLWVGLLSASICVYAGKHIRMAAAQKLVPEGAQRYFNAAGLLAAAAFCALMTYIGFDYLFALEASDDEFMTEAFTLGGTRYVYSFEGMLGRDGYLEGTDVPDWLGILAAPIGFAIATLRFLGAAFSSAVGGSYGVPAAEEGVEEARDLAERENETSEGETGAKADADARADADAKANAEGEEE